MSGVKVKLHAGHLAILLMLAVLIGMIAGPLLQLMTVYPPGWEIRSSIGGIQHLDVIYSERDDFTQPKEVMGVYWKVDLDEPKWGVPTIEILTSDLEHVDFTGHALPNDKPADTILFERGNVSTYLDYHIYMYTVTIRTIADSEWWTGDWLTIDQWKHETSWAFEGADVLRGVGGDHVGEEFYGGVYTKFTIDPWKGFTYREPPVTDNPDEEWYELDSCWAGVMNTYAQEITMGQIANQWGEMKDPDGGAPLHVKGSIPQGYMLPMFLDDGTFGTPATPIDWDPSVTPDEDLQNSVAIYLPAQMSAGAYLPRNWLGTVDNVIPCDVYIMYKLRIDVLTSHGFVLHTAHDPPDPTPPFDFFSYTEDWWASVFEALGLMNPFAVFGPLAPMVAFIFTLLIIGVIFLIFLAIFFPFLFRRLFRSAGEAQHSYRRGRDR